MNVIIYNIIELGMYMCVYVFVFEFGPVNRE
jgi:hypothetical protein